MNSKLRRGMLKVAGHIPAFEKTERGFRRTNLRSLMEKRGKMRDGLGNLRKNSGKPQWE